jgi:hypothetical protein
MGTVLSSEDEPKRISMKLEDNKEGTYQFPRREATFLEATFKAEQVFLSHFQT